MEATQKYFLNAILLTSYENRTVDNKTSGVSCLIQEKSKIIPIIHLGGCLSSKTENKRQELTECDLPDYQVLR